jgi:hypothetical protein
MAPEHIPGPLPHQPPPEPSPAPALPTGRFEGRSMFADIVRQTLSAASAANWKEMIFSDADFESWPLGERGPVEHLNAWARSGRTLTLLARNYDGLIRRHPRFVQWRRTWAHKVECRRSAATGASDFPSAIWTPSWCCSMLDLERCTGMASSDPRSRAATREQIDACLRLSTSGFPAFVLGL